MGRLYFLVLASLATFGWLASNLDRRPAASSIARAETLPDEGRGAAAGETAAGAPTAIYANAIVLEREDDGHFYADVEVNGRPITMLVDTGASGVALSAEDARDAGIATTIGMSQHIGEGAGGAVYGDLVRIDRISLGGTEVRDLSGVVLRGGEMSLLGQDFLRQFASVEISGDRMVLR